MNSIERIRCLELGGGERGGGGAAPSGALDRALTEALAPGGSAFAHEQAWRTYGLEGPRGSGEVWNSHRGT